MSFNVSNNNSNPKPFDDISMSSMEFEEEAIQDAQIGQQIDATKLDISIDTQNVAIDTQHIAEDLNNITEIKDQIEDTNQTLQDAIKKKEGIIKEDKEIQSELKKINVDVDADKFVDELFSQNPDLLHSKSNDAVKTLVNEYVAKGLLDEIGPNGKRIPPTPEKIAKTIALLQQRVRNRFILKSLDTQITNLQSLLQKQQKDLDDAQKRLERLMKPTSAPNQFLFKSDTRRKEDKQESKLAYIETFRQMGIKDLQKLPKQLQEIHNVEYWKRMCTLKIIKWEKDMVARKIESREEQLEESKEDRNKRDQGIERRVSNEKLIQNHKILEHIGQNGLSR